MTIKGMIRNCIIAAFFLLQVGMIVYARYTPSRYFCWAPFDTQSHYAISVKINERMLSRDEIKTRYRIPPVGRDSRSIQHVKNIIKTYETSYGAEDGALVTLYYDLNGKEHAPWIWQDKT